jgi:hypothetical protein
MTRFFPRPLAALLATAVIAAAVGCSSGSPAAPSTTQTVTPSLSLTGSTQMDFVGVTNSLVAIATEANGTSTNVTTLAAWQSANPTAVTISASGVATSVGVGTTIITATYQGLSATITIRVGALIDCSTYFPTDLQLIESASGFTIAAPSGAGLELLQTFATEADGLDGMAVFQRYRNYCHVGRNNTRSSRLAYVVGYWLNQFGLTTTVSRDDCEPYDRATVAIASKGSSGWSVTASGRELLLLDSAADATTMAEMIKTYSNQCYIGRGNTKPDPSQYIIRYWK